MRAAQAGALALDKLRPGHSGVSILRGLAARFAQAPNRERPKAPMTEWASMKDEITRKALQAIQEANAKRDAGTITDRELWLVIDALFDTTQGLVDPDMSALIYRARQELKEHAPQ